MRPLRLVAAAGLPLAAVSCAASLELALPFFVGLALFSGGALGLQLFFPFGGVFEIIHRLRHRRHGCVDGRRHGADFILRMNCEPRTVVARGNGARSTRTVSASEAVIFREKRLTPSTQIATPPIAAITDQTAS